MQAWLYPAIAYALFAGGIYLWVPRVVAFYGRTYFEAPAAKPGYAKILLVGLPLAALLRGASAVYPAAALPFLALMAVALGGVILADAKFQVIPDRFQLVGLVGAAGFAYFSGLGVLPAAAGLALVAALYGLTRLYTLVRKRDALGLGDVKLLAWLALAFGPDTFFVLIYGLGLALVVVVPLLILRRRALHSFFAFGPFLAAGAVARLIEVALLRL